MGSTTGLDYDCGVPHETTRGPVFWRHSADKRHLRDLQQEATRAFESLVFESADERYRFIGSEATVVRRVEAGGTRGFPQRRAGLSVSFFASNAFGELFLIEWHSLSNTRPYIKHMAQQPSCSPVAATPGQT
jgi:hypothetical protein